jgi:cytochrome b561
MTLHYPKGFKHLHWFMALIIISMLTIGFFLSSVPNAFQKIAYMLHKSTGVTILFLMLTRLFWITLHGRPSLPSSIPAWQQCAAKSVHYLLYLFIILMALVGWVGSVAEGYIPSFFNLFSLNLPFIQKNEALGELLFQYHTYFAYILIGLITLHILAALKHLLINKDGVFERMWKD